MHFTSCHFCFVYWNKHHVVCQFAFFDFCAGNHHHIVAGARVKAVKGTPMLLVARGEAAKVAQLIGLSCKCGTNYTLCCCLVRAWVETVKMAQGICSQRTTKNAVWVVCTTSYMSFAIFNIISWHISDAGLHNFSKYLLHSLLVLCNAYHGCFEENYFYKAKEFYSQTSLCVWL